jgi:predicted lipoprotein with Yx(FWY)xxD motif
MKRIVVLAIASVATIALTAGLASASGRQAKLQLRNTSKGKILVDRAGFTLYMFTKDGRNKDACVKISGCTGVWPPLTTSGKSLAGPGVKSSLIGTIKVPHVGTQVTYAGRPLYTYIGDPGPGSTFYVGVRQFHGFWYALNAAGHLVK